MRKAALIQVGHGRGFVLNTSRDNVVITAAHCLPHLPPAHPASFGEERTYFNLLGETGKPPSIAAECVFVDPIADVAVLTSPDNQELYDEYRAYETFMHERPSWIIGAVSGTKAKTFALNGESCECTMSETGGTNRFSRTLTLEGPAEAYAPGTSGSPIFNEQGLIIGLISVGNRLNPILTRCLPPPLLELAFSWLDQMKRFHGDPE